MANLIKNSKAELESLRLPELQARFQEVVGETSLSPNRKFLMRRIDETLAAQGTSAPEATPQATTEQPTAETEVAEYTPVAEPTTPEPVIPEPAATGPVTEAQATEVTGSGSEPTQEQATNTATGPAEATQPEVAPQAEPTTQESPADHTPETAEATTSTEMAQATPPEGASQGASPAEPAKEKKSRGRFAKMSTADLQALYTEKVGRPSGSSHRGYLIWKIREAEKGRITVGPVQQRAHTEEPKEMKVLPLSLEASIVEKMDAAWRAKGIKSRMEFFRQAIGAYLTQLGATEEAALFAAE